MSTSTSGNTTSERILKAGPFDPSASTSASGSEIGRAILTSLLALYPVLATVGVVLFTLAFTRAA